MIKKIRNLKIKLKSILMENKSKKANNKQNKNPKSLKF